MEVSSYFNPTYIYLISTTAARYWLTLQELLSWVKAHFLASGIFKFSKDDKASSQIEGQLRDLDNYCEFEKQESTVKKKTA